MTNVVCGCRYVKNAEVEGEFYKGKQDEIDAEKAKLVRTD